MGFLGKQLLNVVEWKQEDENALFWKWDNDEIKKGSRLIIRPGQDAIFLHNGKIEGEFTEDGDYDIESEIIPFLSTLKAFKFGFNTPMRAEVLFVNTKELLVKWGTKNAINLPAAHLGLPGGMPIRAFGTFSCAVADHEILIEKIAGVKKTFTVDDVKERIVSRLDQLLMKWIGKEGRDMFNLQMNAYDIANGIQEELDTEMQKIGIGITSFNIESFSYPEEIKKMQEKAAAQSMVGDVNKYQQIAFADSMTNGNGGGSVAGDMASMQMGMVMGQQMVANMQMQNQAAPQMGQAAGGAVPKFCPNCGTPTNGSKFCGNCGTKLA